MRNLFAIKDSIFSAPRLESGGPASIEAVDVNPSTGEMLVLDNRGVLRTYDAESGSRLERSWDLSTHAESEEGDFTWFALTILRASGSVVCVSRAGLLISIPIDLVTGTWSDKVEVEGDVEGGIINAAWSPDQNRLVVLTGNNTMLCMNSEWDVIDEVPLIETPVPDTPVNVSWRGDGEQFALQSVDASTETSYVRVYSNELELVSTGRNIADGPGSVLKGVGNAVAFSTNGALIAFPQERIKGKHQIAFIEKNGLRHGDLDVRMPDKMEGYDTWAIENIQWDLTSNLVAVEMRASKEKEEGGFPLPTAPSVVQVYYRDNYHWYLKLQWAEIGLKLLRFDSETWGRLYLSQPLSGAAQSVRVVELAWEVIRNETRDATVAVTDGSNVLLTPLGYNTVPPPMSMFQVSLTGPYKHSCFWSPSPSSDTTSSYTSGLAVLTESLIATGPIFSVQFYYLGAKGEPMEGSGVCVDLNGLECDGARVRPSSLLAVPSSVEKNDNSLSLVLLCNRVDNGEEIVLSLVVDLVQALIVSSAPRKACPASKSRKLFPVQGKDPSQGYALLCNGDGNGEVIIYQSTASDVCEASYALPEECIDAAAVTVDLTGEGMAGSTGSNRNLSVQLCFGLSTRSRLYCGDMLIEAGASSFAINQALGVLLYVTTGTAPHLHFVSLLALAALDPDRDVDLDEGVYQMIEYAPPRPVERGARLVVSVPGDPRVVVQQPRGNLEAFEPRPLVLSRARSLIDAKKEVARYMDCLLMLRRQRVDLNFMVDHDPKRFIHFAPTFMDACVGAGAEEKLVDVLCLFISSLEDGNLSLRKYPQPLIQQLLQSGSSSSSLYSGSAGGSIEGLSEYLESAVGDGKVNVLCQVLRSHLEALLQQGNSTALRPILCTLAKQKPPLMEEALLTIRKAVDATGNALSSAKAQGYIRYLAFLADGELIFNAAVGICDFEMSRAIARQCQMDPKAYLPLLEGFEAIGRLGSGPGSYEHWVMHVEVALHLKRPESVISSGLQALSISPSSSASSADAVEAVMDPQTVSRHILSSTKDAKLYMLVLEQLFEAIRGQAKEPGQQKRQKILDALLSDTRYAYSIHLRSQSDPDRAQIIALLLMTEPPRASEAVETALMDDDWQQAFFIAGKYGNTNDVPTPEELANRIINAYKSELIVSADIIDSVSPDDEAEAETASTSAAKHTKALDVAHMCLDYRDGDMEGAISVLLKSQELLYAAQLASRKRRLDLLTDDVSRASRRAAYEFVENLKRYEEKLLLLVSDLKGLWEDPDKRLAEVREKDEKLARELEWLEGGGDADEYDPDSALDGDVDDSKSEFSMASMRSDLSFVSGASSILSELSNSSQGSRVSKSSRTSAAVSVLSELKLEKKSALGSAGAGTGAGSSFSVKGMEHSLLSRGSGKDDPNAFKKKDRAKKNQMKREKYYQDSGQPLTSKQLRRKNRGEGISNRNRDTLGLGKELLACSGLWKHIQVGALAKRCSELCKVLVLLGTAQDMMLAARVQHSMDTYADAVRNNPAPLAPSYPRKWLAKKDMSILRRYQDIDITTDSPAASTMGKGVPSSLWKVAADGISQWYTSLRLVALNHMYVATDEGGDDDEMLIEMADAGDY